MLNGSIRWIINPVRLRWCHYFLTDKISNHPLATYCRCCQCLHVEFWLIIWLRRRFLNEKKWMPSLATPPSRWWPEGGCGAAQLHILARPFPQGHSPMQPLLPIVSRAFPQEVASALATHGVAPVTSVAYEEEGMDGHLGAGEASYPRVPSHAQGLQTNHCQPHQQVANVSLSAIVHRVCLSAPVGALIVIVWH